MYDAGYDVVGRLDDVLGEFDRVLGLCAASKAIHLNDSKNPMGSHKDRHERIGKGSLGTGGHRGDYQSSGAAETFRSTWKRRMNRTDMRGRLRFCAGLYKGE